MSQLLFGIDLAQVIATELGPLLLDAVLIVPANPDALTTLDPTADPRSASPATEITGKGTVDDYSDFTIGNTNVQAGDRKVLLIANTFAGRPVPKQGDCVRIEGVTYEIVAPVTRDPASAAYTCQCR